MKKSKVYLTLQNGKVFEGYGFGAEGEAVGELVFTTGMVGYHKTLTDPAYYGQIVVQTFPMIGNYGVIPSEFEGQNLYLSAYVVREICEDPSNFRMEETLDNYLKKAGVIGIYGVDTRELTRIVRETGVMNAVLSSKPLKNLDKLNGYTVQNAVSTVSPKETVVLGEENANCSVAFVDYGAKDSAAKLWTEYGCKVYRMPATTTAEEILSLGVDGVVLSEGPGNPMDNVEAIQEIAKLIGKKPIFAVGLGHQMLAIAFGGSTYKMKYGHRGGNQPVKYLESGRVYVSSQNHGYEVEKSSVKEGEIVLVNVNDGGVEGIFYDDKKAIGVQFDPTSCSAAGEENFLIKKFIAYLK